MVLDRQFLFIIGAPRSGTTWLQAMLNENPSICTATFELMLFHNYTAPWERAWKAQYEVNQNPVNPPIGLPTLWKEDEFYAFLREFLLKVYERVLQNKPNATIILDKHPWNGAYSEHIIRLLPDARFIHIIRDGRDVVASMLAASQGWGKEWAPNNVEDAALMWRDHVVKAREARKYSDQYLEIRYEDLLSNGTKTLMAVFNFLNLKIDVEYATSILNKTKIEKMRDNKTFLPKGFLRKGNIGDWHNALNPIERCIFHRTTGDLLCELGYADDSWWFDHGYQRIILPLLSIVLNPNNPKKIRKKCKLMIKRFFGRGGFLGG